MDKNLSPLNEIVGAIVGNMASAEDMAIFAKDPKAVITSQLNIETDATFSVVENSNDTVHLALPYYAMVSEMHAVMLEDETIEDVAGGEILITIGFLAGTALTATLGLSVGLGFAGAAIGAVCVGTTVIAGAAVAADKHIK